jgi:hypothetical protein
VEHVQRSNDRYESIISKIAETNAMFNLTLGLASVGYSCAASKGQVTAEERLQIDEFIVGVSVLMLPTHVKDEMRRMAFNPPDIRTAHAHAMKTATSDTWHLFDEIVTLITRMDEIIPAGKSEFEAQWHYLRRAA